MPLWTDRHAAFVLQQTNRTDKYRTPDAKPAPKAFNIEVRTTTANIADTNADTTTAADIMACQTCHKCGGCKHPSPQQAKTEDEETSSLPQYWWVMVILNLIVFFACTYLLAPMIYTSFGDVIDCVYDLGSGAEFVCRTLRFAIWCIIELGLLVLFLPAEDDSAPDGLTTLFLELKDVFIMIPWLARLIYDLLLGREIKQSRLHIELHDGPLKPYKENPTHEAIALFRWWTCGVASCFPLLNAFLAFMFTPDVEVMKASLMRCGFWIAVFVALACFCFKPGVLEGTLTSIRNIFNFWTGKTTREIMAKLTAIEAKLVALEASLSKDEIDPLLSLDNHHSTVGGRLLRPGEIFEDNQAGINTSKEPVIFGPGGHLDRVVAESVKPNKEQMEYGQGLGTNKIDEDTTSKGPDVDAVVEELSKDWIVDDMVVVDKVVL